MLLGNMHHIEHYPKSILPTRPIPPSYYTFDLYPFSIESSFDQTKPKWNRNFTWNMIQTIIIHSYKYIHLLDNQIYIKCINVEFSFNYFCSFFICCDYTHKARNELFSVYSTDNKHYIMAFCLLNYPHTLTRRPNSAYFTHIPIYESSRLSLRRKREFFFV